MQTSFANRQDAGRQLAARLAGQVSSDVVVVGLPRGGLPVAHEIAQALGVPLTTLLVRKIGAPNYAELAIGAIADGVPMHVHLDDGLVRSTRASADYIEQTIAAEKREIERRRQAWSIGPHWPDVGGRSVIVVDDGVATGATLQAALQALRKAGAARLIAAIPVIAADTLTRLHDEADQWAYLLAPADFRAVGNYYREFPQLGDEAVTPLLHPAGH